MGRSDAAQVVGGAIRLMEEIRRLPVFPLAGALLFPGLHLPLHVFEPRYRSMVSRALASDRLIGMVQPRGPGEPPPLYDVGCLGRMVEFEALDDGRYNILLEGIARFTIARELDVPAPFRNVEAALWQERTEALSAVERAALEEEARRFAAAHSYEVDWDSVARLDDQTLTNAIAQIAPFDPAAKQALLETPDLSGRVELLMQLMQFFAAREEPGGQATLQ